MGRDKGYLKTPFSENNSFPQQKIIHSRTSIELKLRNPTVAIANRKSRSSDRLNLGAPKSLWTVPAAMKRHLLLGRKAMINLDSILKSRDITLPTKVCIVKVMVFLVVMYRCESWTIKKVEHQRIDAFKLWC